MDCASRSAIENISLFIEAAEELGALFAVHAAPTQGIGVDGFDRLIEVRTLSHGFGQMIQMTSMIYNGVYDRFPEIEYRLCGGRLRLGALST